MKVKFYGETEYGQQLEEVVELPDNSTEEEIERELKTWYYDNFGVCYNYEIVEDTDG